MVASVVEEEALALDDVLQILDETSRLRAHSAELEEKSKSLEQATRELRAANEQLKSLDRLKDDFMSSVTHELRTPLTSIRALSEMMAEDPDMPAEQRQQFLGIVVAETERLSRLVNQVLDMAKIESGHAEWRNADVDMGQLLAQSVQTTSEMFRARGASVQLSLPQQPVVLRADPDRLTQVMLNLLSNAAKFVPDSDGRVEVSLDHRSRWIDRGGQGQWPRCTLATAGPDLREVPPGRRRVPSTAGHRPGLAHQPADRGTLRRADVDRFRAGPGCTFCLPSAAGRRRMNNKRARWSPKETDHDTQGIDR